MILSFSGYVLKQNVRCALQSAVRYTKSCSRALVRTLTWQWLLWNFIISIIMPPSLDIIQPNLRAWIRGILHAHSFLHAEKRLGGGCRKAEQWSDLIGAGDLGRYVPLPQWKCQCQWYQCIGEAKSLERKNNSCQPNPEAKHLVDNI